MDERRLGPVVRLGSWNTFGADRETARAMVDAALDSGVRVFDSLPIPRRFAATARGETGRSMKPDETRTAWRGKHLAVSIERWGDRDVEIVEHPGSVAIVAVDAEGRVVLVRQPRQPARKHLVELPAGTLEEGEDAEATARRELEEETGLHGGRWRKLGRFWTSPGFLREDMHLFLAAELEQGEPNTEEDEEIELVRWPRDEVEQRLGEIEDAKTLAGLLLYLRLDPSSLAD